MPDSHLRNAGFTFLQHLPGSGASGHQVLFHTAWFTESLLTQILAALAGCAAALALPATPAGTWLGLASLPPLPVGRSPGRAAARRGPAGQRVRGS